MNDDLNTSLDRAVDSALDQAMSADTMRRTVAERIRAKRRRRPALVIGSTLGSLALVGGTAFAAVQLLGDDDRGPVPDVIGSARPERPTASPSPTPPTGETTEPAPPAPEPVATLPLPDPSAVFPACGAPVDPPAGRADLTLASWSSNDPLGTTYSANVWGTTMSDLRGDLSTDVTVVAVKDGIVVGSTVQTGGEGTIPFELTTSGGQVPGGTGTLAHTLCTDSTVPLPAGRYSIWASTEYTITERTDYDENYVAQPTVTTPEAGATLDQIASLWMGPQGVAIAHPGITPGWPQNLDEETAYSGAQTEPETVVWIQTSERVMYDGFDPTLTAARDRVADLGYLVLDIPFACQSEAPALLGLGDNQELVDRYGVGLVFTTRAEAETFASLWEPIHGPVAGIVTSAVTCHFT